MKIRAFVMLVAVFLMVWSGAAAQDVPEGTTGTIVQTASSVTFEETEDGVFTITLADVDAAASVLIYAPGVGAGFYPLTELAADWTYGEGDALLGQALLQSGAQTLDLMIGMPVYDEEEMTLTFTGTVEEIFEVGVEGGKDPIPEESYEAATLFILADFDFISGLEGRRVARIEDGRLITAQSCFPGRSC